MTEEMGPDHVGCYVGSDQTSGFHRIAWTNFCGNNKYSISGNYKNVLYTRTFQQEANSMHIYAFICMRVIKEMFYSCMDGETHQRGPST